MRLGTEEKPTPAECPQCQGRGWNPDENDNFVDCEACNSQEATQTTAQVEEVEVDPFIPPPDIEAACQAILKQLDEFLPMQPKEAPPSLVGAPPSLDKNQAMQVLVSVGMWLEFLQTQAGERRAQVKVLAAGVNWMKGHVAFAHKNKVDKLKPEQHQKLQDYEYRQLLKEAEVLRIESMIAQQRAVKDAASRNLSGSIAQ